MKKDIPYSDRIEKAIIDTLNGLLLCMSKPEDNLESIIKFTLFSGSPVCEVREKFLHHSDSICFSPDSFGTCPLQTKDGHCGGGCLDSGLYRAAVAFKKRPEKKKLNLLNTLLFKKYNAILRTVRGNGWMKSKIRKNV